MIRAEVWLVLNFIICVSAFADSQLTAVAESASDLNRTVPQTVSPAIRRCDVPQGPPNVGQQHKEDSATSDTLLNRCLKDPAVTERRWKGVSYVASQLCKKPNTMEATPAAYRIRKQDGKIQVAMTVIFDYKGGMNNLPGVLRRLGSVRDCISRFYARFGINLELDFNTNPGVSSPKSGDLHVDLWDKYPRYNSANWAMIETCGVSLTEDQACGAYAHELGHLLGLPDRYVEPNCPDRELGPHDSVMRAGGWNGSKSVRLYPNDIAIILEPLCGH